MTTRPAFVAPVDVFSLACIGESGQDRDWSNPEEEATAWEVVRPTLTIAVVLEREPDLIDDRDDAQALRADPAQGLDADLKDEFEQTDGFDQWRDSFDPMMNYAWPVELAYGVEAQTAADLIDQFAGSVCLIYRGDDVYEIALTGGGMDLSADIAMAYMCCGCVPPLVLLTNLSRTGETRRLDRFPLGAVYERAAEWLDARRADLAQEMKRLFESR